MYRGRKRHDRLFQDVGPKMWNFTGRAVIIPDLADIIELLSCKETVTEPQIDIESLKSEDVFLGKKTKYYYAGARYRYYSTQNLIGLSGN